MARLQSSLALSDLPAHSLEAPIAREIVREMGDLPPTVRRSSLAGPPLIRGPDDLSAWVQRRQAQLQPPLVASIMVQAGQDAGSAYSCTALGDPRSEQPEAELQGEGPSAVLASEEPPIAHASPTAGVSGDSLVKEREASLQRELAQLRKELAAERAAKEKMRKCTVVCPECDAIF